MRRPYAITTIAVRADREIEVSVHGPGYPPAGQRFVFADRERAAALVDALNMAHEEGTKEGYENARLQFATRQTH
jgi:hypothetical protein